MRGGSLTKISETHCLTSRIYDGAKGVGHLELGKILFRHRFKTPMVLESDECPSIKQRSRDYYLKGEPEAHPTPIKEVLGETFQGY